MVFYRQNKACPLGKEIATSACMAPKKRVSPVTIQEIGHFFNRTVEPRLHRIISEEIQPLKFEMNGRFDDLYKKLEALEEKIKLH